MITTPHTDTYSLAGTDRACVLTYPTDLSADEVFGAVDWLQLIAWKLGRASSVVTRDALRRAELADTDATLTKSQERCDRLRAERDELTNDLTHQKSLVNTLAERVAAQSELLSKRAAKTAPDLPEVTPVPDTPYPAVLVVAEESPRLVMSVDLKHLEAAPENTRTRASDHRRANRRANRLAIAIALANGPLRQREICAATGISQGTMSSLLPLPTHGWWRKSDVGAYQSPYELTGKGRDALIEAGVGFTTPTTAAAPAPIAPEAPALKIAPHIGRPLTPEGMERDRARCKLIAETLDKLLVPLAAVSIGLESRLDVDDVARRLGRHPEWFERAGSVAGGDKYKLTAAGRELAREQEAA